MLSVAITASEGVPAEVPITAGCSSEGSRSDARMPTFCFAGAVASEMRCSEIMPPTTCAK
jgi:hypothetical protein